MRILALALFPAVAVTVMCTGGGQTSPGGVDGRIETQSLPRVAQSAMLSIGGQNAEVVFAGGVYQGWAGLLMLQARVPSAAASGDAIPVVLSIGGATSQAWCDDVGALSGRQNPAAAQRSYFPGCFFAAFLRVVPGLPRCCAAFFGLPG